MEDGTLCLSGFGYLTYVLVNVKAEIVVCFFITRGHVCDVVKKTTKEYAHMLTSIRKPALKHCPCFTGEGT
jgi:hypothetical protein